MFTRKRSKARVNCNINCTHFYKLSNNTFAPVKYLFCKPAVIFIAFSSSIEDTALWNNAHVKTVHQYKFVNSQYQSLFFLNSWFRASWFNVNKKVQLDATVCRHLFTAESLYMFRVSQHPSSGVLETVTATSGIGHTVKYKLKIN